MEQMLKFLPVLMAMLDNPVVKQVLEQFGKMAKSEFPALPVEQAQEAMGTVSRENEVLWIQTALVLLGTSVTIDGNYGADTKSAVSSFQAKNGLGVDGWAGKVTQQKLRDMLLKGVA